MKKVSFLIVIGLMFLMAANSIPTPRAASGQVVAVNRTQVAEHLVRALRLASISALLARAESRICNTVQKRMPFGTSVPLCHH